MNPLHVVMAGGSGFLGQSLSRALTDRGCRVTVLTRSAATTCAPHVRTVCWDACSQGEWVEAIDGADAILNFAGKNVNCRLTEANRRASAVSRVAAVNALVEAIDHCRKRPDVFIQCSAVGVYGHTTRRCDEREPVGRGALATIASASETAFEEAELTGVRKVVLRLGVVLGREGGAFPVLARLARAYLGGMAGCGRQGFSWIHIQDLNRVFLEILENSNLRGTFNAVSPQPVTNADFMRALRKNLGRPWTPPVPAVFLRTAGVVLDFNSELILTGQQCVPDRLVKSGFQFDFADLEHALGDLLRPV